MSVRKAMPAVFAALLLAAGCAGAGTSSTDPAYTAVLDAALTCQASRGADCHAMDRIFDLKRTSKQSMSMLVSLLDYQLGSASGGTLAEFLTQAGKETAPLLREKRATPLDCLPKYQSLCRETVATRNAQID